MIDKTYLAQLENEFDAAIENGRWPPFDVPAKYLYPNTGERDVMYSWLLDHVDIHEVSRMMDVGMLGGRFVRRLDQQGLICDGIDISTKAVKCVIGQKLRGRFEVASIDHIPFHDMTYDWVNCISVMEYNPLEIVATGLSEIRRILKREGKLSINFPDANSVMARNYARMEEYLGTKFYLENIETIENVIGNAGFITTNYARIGMAHVFIARPI